MTRIALILLLVFVNFKSLRAGYYSTPAVPNINTNNVIVVTNAAYGAVGDGATTNTAAIQAAIARAAAGGLTNGASGGTVEIPPGIYLCGPLTMASSVNLQLDAGAILRMLPLGMYPGGTNTGTTFISGSRLHDIEISGSGAIDGQGAGWWPYPKMPRAIMISPSECNRILIQNVTLSNSPMFHIAISGSHSGNATVQNVTIRAPSNSPNTDACDVDGTNVLVQNCDISVGDDNFTCGGGTSGVLLTNNTYGTGHGISIGSYTGNGGVSNITVINCTMNGAVNGIRIKSDNDRGGMVQNISYYNISITNVNFPIQIYGYYNEVGTPSSISPYYAATQAVAAVSDTTPIFRNITFSNITATSVKGYPIGVIWARTEMPATNLVFNKLNIAGDRSFDLYNVRGAQFMDCALQTSARSNTFSLFNASVLITNSVPLNQLFTFEGLSTNGYGNALSFYNATGALKNTNALGAGALNLAASVFTVSNNWNFAPQSVLNLTIGTNAASMAVTGDLALGGVVNISAGSGFTNGSYPVMKFAGSLSGLLPEIGSTPAGFSYSYSWNTNTPGLVNLLVSLPAPTNLIATATNLQVNLQWNSVYGAATYNVRRGTTSGGPYALICSGLLGTNYEDTNVTNATAYYYVITANGPGGESLNSVEASAAPLPSALPVNLAVQVVAGQLQMAWPQDHLGWQLQMQTNAPGEGIGTNWFTVSNSSNVMSTNMLISPSNGPAFFRLVYP